MTQEITIREGAGGVKTPEGKAISRYNAQKHGILREAITEYEKTDAEQIFNDLADDLKPKGRLQELLIENIASNAVRLLRIAKAEAELIKETISPNVMGVGELSFKKYRPVMTQKDIEKLEIYSRYQTAAENRIFRALAIYKQLRDYKTE